MVRDQKYLRGHSVCNPQGNTTQYEYSSNCQCTASREEERVPRLEYNNSYIYIHKQNQLERQIQNPVPYVLYELFFFRFVRTILCSLVCKIQKNIAFEREEGDQAK